MQLHESKLQLHKSKLQFLLLCSVTDRCCRTHNPEIQGMFSFVVLVASSLCCFSLAWREIFSDYISRNFQDGSWPSAPTHTSAQNPEERLDSELDPKTQKENTMFWLLIWKEIFGLGSNFFFPSFFFPLPLWNLQSISLEFWADPV